MLISHSVALRFTLLKLHLSFTSGTWNKSKLHKKYLQKTLPNMRSSPMITIVSTPVASKPNTTFWKKTTKTSKNILPTLSPTPLSSEREPRNSAVSTMISSLPTKLPKIRKSWWTRTMSKRMRASSPTLRFPPWVRNAWLALSLDGSGTAEKENNLSELKTKNERNP